MRGAQPPLNALDSPRRPPPPSPPRAAAPGSARYSCPAPSPGWTCGCAAQRSRSAATPPICGRKREGRRKKGRRVSGLPAGARKIPTVRRGAAQQLARRWTQRPAQRSSVAGRGDAAKRHWRRRADGAVFARYGATHTRCPTLRRRAKRRARAEDAVCAKPRGGRSTVAGRSKAWRGVASQRWAQHSLCMAQQDDVFARRLRDAAAWRSGRVRCRPSRFVWLGRRGADGARFCVGVTGGYAEVNVVAGGPVCPGP